MIYTENVTPTGLAARLAEYIADPSTIRARVKEHFGRAPSVDQCRNLRLAVESRKVRHVPQSDSKFTIFCQRHEGPYELDEDGYYRCIHCKEEKRQEEKARADEAAWIDRQFAAMQAKVERERQRRLEVAEEAHRHELVAADKVLGNVGKPILFADLIVAVAAAFDMTPEDITGLKRHRIYADARTALAQILKTRGSSYPMIGRRMNRDHSSIVHLLQGYDFRAKRNPLIALVVDRLA